MDEEIGGPVVEENLSIVSADISGEGDPIYILSTSPGDPGVVIKDSV